MEGSTVLERMAACLPCASWPCAGGGRHWQLWPGEFDDDAQPILTAPTPALAECLIPPSVSSLYDDRGQSSPESSAPSWDIGAGRPPAHQMSRQRGRGGMALSPKGQGARGVETLDRSSGQQGGIELKQAAANPLLGQFHLQDGGRFVKAKLPSANPARQSGRPENGATTGAGSAQPSEDSRVRVAAESGLEELLENGNSAKQTTGRVESHESGVDKLLENGNAAEQTGGRGGSPRQENGRRQRREEGEDLGGPPAA